jgi:hypothetical protein
MPETWQEALLLLHRRGWRGEWLDEACARLGEACLDGELAGRSVERLRPQEITGALGQALTDEEARALARVCDVHTRADSSGRALREALRDLDAFDEGVDPGDVKPG